VSVLHEGMSVPRAATADNHVQLHPSSTVGLLAGWSVGLSLRILSFLRITALPTAELDRCAACTLTDTSFYMRLARPADSRCRQRMMIIVRFLPVADASEHDLHINDAQRSSRSCLCPVYPMLQFISFPIALLLRQYSK